MFDTILETIFTTALLTCVESYMSLHISTPSLHLRLLRIGDNHVQMCISITVLQMRSLSECLHLDPLHIFL
jgi:hypothetical protein